MFSTSSLTLLPLIASTTINNILPPSNAGKRIAFTTAKLTLKYAIKYTNCSKLLAVLTTLYIPTGPDNAFRDNFPVNKLPIIKNILDTIEPNLVNAYLIEAPNVFIASRNTPIENSKKMIAPNKPCDYNNLKIDICYDNTKNLEVELDSLQKEKEKLILSIERRKKLLSNENYLKKAPSEIVMKEKNDLAKEESRLETILDKLDSLK